MKRTLACCLACLVLAACAPADDFTNWLFGAKHNVVVLAPNALELSRGEVSFSPPIETEVVGKDSSVCFVLAGNVPKKSWKEIENEAQRLLNGAELSATVTTSDRVPHEFKAQGISWSRSGRVTSSSEIAACVQVGRSKDRIPIGSKVRSVAITSTAPVHILGAYWDSTAAFDRNGN